MSKTREYSNGEVTIVWEPGKCIHSGICARGLPHVFNPKVRPWVAINADVTERLVNQVKACPSGALTYYMNNAEIKEAKHLETKVEVLKNGPLLVYGNLQVTLNNGVQETKTKTTAFCRCGESQNKPYCDGTHVKINFLG